MSILGKELGSNHQPDLNSVKLVKITSESKFKKNKYCQ